MEIDCIHAPANNSNDLWYDGIDDDTHLLPFDGAINWDKVMLNLEKCKEVRYLTMEADFNRNHEKSLIYSDLSAIEFLSLAHSRLLKLINTK